MQNKNTLIIFVKNPVRGKVKSRLAKTIGEEKSLQVYKLLLQHTRGVTLELNCDRFVFYADFIPQHDLWNMPGYYLCQQQGNDLGERMSYAFGFVFNQGYQNVVIIGSDCYELETTGIEMAFDLLREAPVVIGPANDGGYYLLGLQQTLPDLFSGIPWSTKHVLQDTYYKLQRLHKNYELLPALNDIDTVSDLPDEIKIKIGLANTQINK